MLSDAVMGLRDAEIPTIACVKTRCDDGVYILIFNHTTLKLPFWPFRPLNFKRPLLVNVIKLDQVR